jgi:opacity protein-like surface antigen
MAQRTRFAILAATLLVLAMATPLQAGTTAETVELEGYLGLYMPAPDLDDDVTAGIRAGYNITQYFQVTGTLGFASADADRGGGEVDWVFTEFSFVWNILPEEKVVPILFGGPGYAFSSSDDDLGPDLDDDSFTLHVGAGFKWDLTTKMDLRFAARARYFENRDDDETDTELTIGVGWKFGG